MFLSFECAATSLVDKSFVLVYKGMRVALKVIWPNLLLVALEFMA